MFSSAVLFNAAFTVYLYFFSVLKLLYVETKDWLSMKADMTDLPVCTISKLHVKQIAPRTSQLHVAQQVKWWPQCISLLLTLLFALSDVCLANYKL